MVEPTIQIIREDDSSQNSAVPLLIQVLMPETGSQRAPMDICCVIDTSGSMMAEASIRNASGVEESNGLNLLDVAKHGVRTVMATLGDQDRCAIVAFESSASVCSPLEYMTAEGRARADARLDQLVPRGGTRMWSGMQHGLELLEEKEAASGEGRLGHLIVLTDGVTSDKDILVSELLKYKEATNSLPGSISTMGFGYGIDSRLLDEVAQIGGGSYSFIPDAGFVGTVFVNIMSNLLVSKAKDVNLVLTTKHGAEVTTVCGQVPKSVTRSADSVRIYLGLLPYGQSRDVIVHAKLPPRSVLTASIGAAAATCSTAAAAAAGSCYEGCMAWFGRSSPPPKRKVTSEADIALLHRQVQRCDFVDTVAKLLNADDKTCAKETLQALSSRITSSKVATDEHILKLLEDIHGQVSEAFNDEYWKRWGRHYVPSIVCAHRLQICNNFKDPGVQVYGGKMFLDVQDCADQLFNDLPAPKPSRAPRGGGVRQAPIQMAHYNDRNAG